MKELEWRERIKSRLDITIGLIHLTKANTDDEAFEKLWEILMAKKLIGGRGFVNGNTPVCCFQETPLGSIAEALNYEGFIKGEKVRYSPFGIRVIKGNIFLAGGRPVIYGKSEELKKILPANEHWRIVDLDLENKESIVDWTHEREWRVKNEYYFEYPEIEVLLKNGDYFKRFVAKCISEEKTDLLMNINGIINISSLYC